MSVEYAVELKFQNHRLTWAELHIFVERYMSASGHIGGFDRLAYDFSIALNVELGSFALAVDHGHHALALILTGYDIDTLVGDELSLTSLPLRQWSKLLIQRNISFSAFVLPSAVNALCLSEAHPPGKS